MKLRQLRKSLAEGRGETLRYCARPLFASERLDWLEPDQRLVYHLPKPRPDGQTALSLTPLEFLDHLAALIPPPRKHRHRYHGALAPHSPLRPAVTVYAGLPMDAPAGPPQAPAPPPDAVERPGIAPARYISGRS